MSSKIINSYKFRADELKLIETNFISHIDWDKNIFSNLKREIRDALRLEQNNKCCYCKKELGFDIKEVDIEHILPKATYPCFTFEPKNLALSCPACNTIKGDKKVLNIKIKRYPKHSNDINIIHAHYDDYEENIMIHDGCVFEPLSSKGSNTITVCELFRLKTVEKKAKEVLQSKTKEGQLIELIRNSSKEEILSLIAELSRKIK